VFKWLSHGRQYGLPLPSGRIDWLCWSVVSLLVLTASPVSAQTWTLSFSPSASHSTLVNGTAVVTAYEYVITPAGGSALAVQTLGKPAPVNGTITVDISTYINGLTPSTCVGGCTAIVRAVGPAGATASVPSASFTTALPMPVPAAPGAPSIIKTDASQPPPAEAAPLTLAWDANTEPDIAGYEVGYRIGGPSNPETVVSAGNVTEWTWTPPAVDQSLIFRVYASNTSGLRSLPSNEVSFVSLPK
jgi:hypothetical protein